LKIISTPLWAGAHLQTTPYRTKQFLSAPIGCVCKTHKYKNDTKIVSFFFLYGVILRLFSKKIIANYDKNVKSHSSMCKGKK
jgi:hypothetical protein